MFTRRSNTQCDLVRNRSTVYVVKESYWQSLQMRQQNVQLYLCKKILSNGLPCYEILYRGGRIFSICRMTDLKIAENRFQCLTRLVASLLPPNGSYRKTSLISKVLQKTMDTISEHPNWLDVHIAAYNGFVDFFKKANLTSYEIDSQMQPDMCTPLHLAILQGYYYTLKAIFAWNPNINLMDSEQNSILHYATISKLDILDTLLKVENIRSLLMNRNNKQLNPFELACLNQKKDNVQRLMSFGLSVRMLSIVNPKYQHLLDQMDNVQLIQLTKTEMDDLDMSSLHLGGCPLHWALTPDIIERLLKLGFLINTPNLNEENPLMVMVRKNRFKCALSLLYNGAEVNQPCTLGDFAVHIATRNANVLLVKCLIIFDADINVKTGKGESVLHLAANGDQTGHQEIVLLLKSAGALPCKIACVTNCTEECRIGESAAAASLQEQPVSNLSNSSVVTDHECIVNTSSCENINDDKMIQKVCDSVPEIPCQTVRMLCLDGGGVKGLFAVQMMIELNKYLRYDLGTYFDWVAGTSTGALIALSLAKKKSLTEMRKLYFIFKDKILTGNRPYSDENLELLLHDELGATGRMCDITDEFDKKLIFTATRVDHHPPSLQIFRSYPYPSASSSNNQLTNMLVWKALRATAAAPTFFRAFPPYIDGGMISNNPTLDALTEFFRYQTAIVKHNQKGSSEPKWPLPQLRLVLSFGNSQMQPKKKDLRDIFNRLYYFLNLSSSIRDLNRAPWILNELAQQVKHLVTNCNDHVVFRASNWCNELGMNFYRLNPVINMKVSLNETNDSELINALWEVKLYAQQMRHELQHLAQVIEGHSKSDRTCQ